MYLDNSVKRGDIFYADLSPVVGSEQGGVRPVLIVLSCGLPKESVILLEQVRTLDKRRLREKMGRLDNGVMKQVDTAIAVSFGLHPETMV